MLVAVLAAAAVLFPGAALAAASPTVISGAATSIAQTSVVLQGRVNPDGRATTFFFSYGPTTAYTANGASHSVGAGTKAVDVSETITGLTPGSTYHYRIVAVNGSGSAFGNDRAFTTAGPPPAAVVTNQATSVTQTTAVPTGVINPEGGTTSWQVQYGLSTAYGYETDPQTLTGGVGAVPVSAQLAGLSPGTLFHYRIIAYHDVNGTAFPTAGADATFFTEPSVPPTPRLTYAIAPSTATHSPYTYTISGTLKGADGIPAVQRCAGNVGIRFFNAKRQLAFVVAPIGSACTYSVQASFRRYYGHGATTLRATIDYRGTGYVGKDNRVAHVTAG
jgi:hypothetical protein